jgi:hypothetical protein
VPINQKLVLPKTNDADSLLGDQRLVLSIASSVTANFGFPIPAVHAYGVPALWATVPITSIDEDRNSASLKKEIWLSDDVLRMHCPSTNSRPNEQRTEPSLGALVAFRPRSTHTF